MEGSSTSGPADVAARLARLEAVESIKALKHRYFRACDAKDPEGFRSCFRSAGSVLDYGELGTLAAADMASVFQSIALKKVDDNYVVLDMHHGLHPDITVHPDGTASGRWTLQFRQVNTVEQTEMLSTGEYDDTYVVEDGQWKIDSCRFRRIWSITRPIDDQCRIEQHQDS